MNEITFHLDGNWGTRSENANACGERLALMLTRLAALHPAFARWNEQANTREAANRPFCAMPPSADELAHIFRKDAKYTQPDRHGYSVTAWNGKDMPYGLSLTVDAGDGADRSRFFPNNVEISFQHYESANTDLINFTVMRQALLCMVAAWDPDFIRLDPWGYLSRWVRDEPWNDDDRKAVRSPGQRFAPRVTSGWMVYLCPDYARRVTPPSGIETEAVAGGGLLMIATRDVFTPGKPEHDVAAEAIQQSLLPLQNLPR